MALKLCSELSKALHATGRCWSKCPLPRSDLPPFMAALLLFMEGAVYGGIAAVSLVGVRWPPWSAVRVVLNVEALCDSKSTSASLHCIIKYKKLRFQYNLHQDACTSLSDSAVASATTTGSLCPRLCASRPPAVPETIQVMLRTISKPYSYLRTLSQT
eukprot:2193095-Rhodomonas_salina.1